MSSHRQNALSAAADYVRASIRNGEPVLCVGGPKHYEFMCCPGHPGFVDVPVTIGLTSQDGEPSVYRYVYREVCRWGDGGIMFLGLFVGENVYMDDSAVIRGVAAYWIRRMASATPDAKGRGRE